MMNFKEEYIKLLREVNRDGVEDLIQWLENSDFFISPASTQYHGSYPGGLLEHSLNVYNALSFQVESLKESGFNIPEIDRESLILVALLHDLCKVNTYHVGTRNVKNEKGVWEQVEIYKREPLLPMGHAGKSLFIIQRFIQLSVGEALAIYWHMGAYDISQYSTWNELSQAYNEHLLAFLLNQADMMATYIMENPYYK